MEIGLSKLPWYGQIASFLLITAAGYLVFHLYWLVPMRDERVLDLDELAELALESEQALREAGRLDEVDREVVDLERRLEDIRAALPDERDAPEILRRLQTLAVQSNLSIRAFTPQAVKPGDGYVAWPIRLDMNGQYHDVGTFF